MFNFKEGGTPQEPLCEFLFAIHNGEGFTYRKENVQAFGLGCWLFLYLKRISLYIWA